MRNKRRQAVIPDTLPITDEHNPLGPNIEARVGPGLAPENLGNLINEMTPTTNPFYRDEILNKVGNRKKSESQGEREARLARRLLVLLRRRG